MNTQPIEAEDLGSEHLILGHYSLGAQPFETRCAAAGAAGFDAIGMLYPEYVRLVHEQGRSAQDMIDFASAQGMRIVEIEAMQGWSAARTRNPKHVSVNHCLEMAAAFGARHLVAIGLFEGTLKEAARGFRMLCDRAREFGARVGLEPIPVQGVPDIAAAREIVERADRANGGICVDSWHLFRGGEVWQQLESLPSELVSSVQINDGTLQPEHEDYIEDCLWNRRLCGEGEFDLDRFVQTLDAIGSHAPISVEVISKTLWAEDPFDVARRMADTTRATLARARVGASIG